MNQPYYLLRAESREKVTNLLMVERAAGSVEMIAASIILTRLVSVELIGKPVQYRFRAGAELREGSSRFHCSMDLTQDEFLLYAWSRESQEATR